jgi:hypothetical protein
MHGIYKNVIHKFLDDLKKIQEQSKIQENELPDDSIETNIKCHDNSIGTMQGFQEELYYDSYEEFLSYYYAPLHFLPITSMTSKYATKGRFIQGKRRFHRTPLNIPEVDFQVSDIPIEKFSTFFENTSQDAKKHLFRFNNTCDVFNITEDNVTCRLVLQTLRGDALEWHCSLLPMTITNSDVLYYLFAE